MFGRRESSGKHLVCESCCHGNNLCNGALDCNRHGRMYIFSFWFHHFNDLQPNVYISTTLFLIKTYHDFE